VLHKRIGTVRVVCCQCQKHQEQLTRCRSRLVLFLHGDVCLCLLFDSFVLSVWFVK